MTAPAVATQVIEVEFKGNRRAFYTWSGETPPPMRAALIVQVERGEDFARVHSIGELALKRHAGTSHGKASPAELPAAVRLATKYEVDTAVRLRVDEDAVRKAALEIVRELKLDMKVSDTEWQWDRRRLTCYFTAEERVDFRQLVRQLERRFSTRVHMWHIGVRDEARRLDGVGRCGRQFCSSSWLPELRPVKSSSAKDQRLSTLNPAQISGTCGRLMCCLRHEHEFYVQSRKRFPKEGKIVPTSLGEEKIVSNDIFRDTVTLRTATGDMRTIPLVQFKKELGESAPAVEEGAGGASSGNRELVQVRREAPARQGERPASPARPPKPTTPAPSVPPANAATPAAAAQAAEEDVEDTDEETGNEASDSAQQSADDTSPDTSDASATATDGSTRPRGRRRRGRRGGRRGRGGEGGEGGGSTPPAPGAPPAS